MTAAGVAITIADVNVKLNLKVLREESALCVRGQSVRATNSMREMDCPHCENCQSRERRQPVRTVKLYIPRMKRNLFAPSAEAQNLFRCGCTRR